MKILLTISYDGSNYFGWQRQKNAITVQQIIEEKLSVLLKQNIKIIGAGRTDSKVHALDQKATFNIDKCPVPINKLPLAINNLLPHNIVITNAKMTDENFHVRHDVLKKTYEYKILNFEYPIPQYRNYCWHIKNNLDTEKMASATKYFIGTKDFAGFCAAGSSVKSTIRTIYDFTVTRSNNFIIFEITGNGFLYNMVRIIIGTIVNIGEGKIKLSDTEKIINTKKRIPISRTAPPQGLTLTNITYKNF